MQCPACQRAMSPISNDTGMGVAILSFYCRKCDISYTDRESVEAAMERMKSVKKQWVVSQLTIKGCAS